MQSDHLDNDTFLKRIGTVIQKCRIREGENQTYMASRIHVAQPALSKYEQGKVNIPVLTLKEISDAYDFPITDFFVDVELPSRTFKRLLRSKKIDEYTEDDKQFDEEMLRPENRKALRVLSSANTLLDNNSDKNTEEVIVSFAVERVAAETRQVERILKYAELIQKHRRSAK
ncbi:MAG: helix-turn-helix transcriptional regulator [Lachnospiraceae bacterium]|nr:helix-turn-helix transcriptional regulator [Lachnospiraceae bacterium]